MEKCPDGLPHQWRLIDWKLVPRRTEPPKESGGFHNIIQEAHRIYTFHCAHCLEFKEVTKT